METDASPPTAPLSPRAARVFLNAADAWHPVRSDPARPGASSVDLLAALEGTLTPREVESLSRTLWVLEWLPRLQLRRRGFSWLDRPGRRALLRRLEEFPFAPLRRRVLRLRTVIDASYQRALDQRSPPSA